jgi:protein-S-isoprenylcysteine O-methyltransferase Ste14
MKYFLLCALWFLWSFLHSWLVATRTSAWFKRRLGKKRDFYRLFYNLFAMITVLPLLYWQHTLRGPIVIPLRPDLMILKYAAFVFSIMVIAGAFFTFDVREFAGIRKRGAGDQQREKEPVIRKHGLYGIVRHPMYLGGITFFAASMLRAPLPQFLGYSVLVLYMIIGTVREDRRLARELGKIYRDYQKEVPMIIPGLPRKKDPGKRA